MEDLPIPQNWERTQLVSVLADLCKEMHTKAEFEANLFETTLKRKVYITPKSYLDMLKLFILKLRSKYQEMSAYRNKLKNGLDKL